MKNLGTPNCGPKGGGEIMISIHSCDCDCDDCIGWTLIDCDFIYCCHCVVIVIVFCCSCSVLTDEFQILQFNSIQYNIIIMNTTQHNTQEDEVNAAMNRDD